MFPAQATNHVIKLFPWHLRLWMKESKCPQTPNITLSVFLPLFLSFSDLPLTGCEHGKLHPKLLYFFFLLFFSTFVLACLECPEWLGFECFFGQLNWIQRARKAVSLQKKKKQLHWIANLWRALVPSNVAVCDVRSVWESLGMSDRQGGGGGDVREMLQSNEWQMCRCASVVRFRREKRGGWGW